MAQGGPRARVGSAGWKKPLWRGQFYPPGLTQARELAYVAARLETLEINASFHALLAPTTYRKWYAETPDDFVFSVKAPRSITHRRRLGGEADVAEFLASGPLELREKLGPILWQLPETMSFDAVAIGAFLAALRGADAGNGPLRHAIEARHPSFVDAGFTELLRRHGVAAVVTNAPGLPALREATSDFVYARLHSEAAFHPDGYDDAALDEWAATVAGWLAEGRDAFVYFKNPDQAGTRVPFDAVRLQERLGGAPARSDAQPPQPSLW
jgi:uncharacterized protein YecE (DUF72 family)